MASLAALSAAAEFTGAKSSDLLVRWKDWETTVYPGVDTKGFHGETKIRPAKSSWTNAELITVGGFSGSGGGGDVLVRWNGGNVSLYPGVDTAGTHAEVQLVG